MQGRFWLADSPAEVIGGEYSAEEGLLRVQGGELVSCMVVIDRGPDSLTRTWRNDGDAEYRVHGELLDGTAVTIPVATRGRCEHNGETVQEFLFLQSLEGAHVGDDVRVVSARAKYSALGGWRWAGPVEFFAGASGSLEAAEDRVSFNQVPSLRIEEVERFLLGPLSSLLTLLSGTRVTNATLEVTADAGAVIIVRRRSRDLANLRTSDLWLDPTQLPLSSIEAWYAVSDKLTPLPTAVAKTISSDSLDVEVRILTLAAAAEAIHRTLYDKKVMPKDQASQIRQAAMDAVPPEVRDRVGAMLGGLREMSFGDRVTEMVGRLGLDGNEICGPEVLDIKTRKLSKTVGRGAWIERLKQARNGFAHQSRRSPDELRAYALEMQVLYESLRWALTAWLLLELDLAANQVLGFMRRSRAYEASRARRIDTWPEVFAP